MSAHVFNGNTQALGWFDGLPPLKAYDEVRRFFLLNGDEDVFYVRCEEFSRHVAAIANMQWAPIRSYSVLLGVRFHEVIAQNDYMARYFHSVESALTRLFIQVCSFDSDFSNQGSKSFKVHSAAWARALYHDRVDFWQRILSAAVNYIQWAAPT